MSRLRSTDKAPPGEIGDDCCCCPIGASELDRPVRFGEPPDQLFILSSRAQSRNLSIEMRDGLRAGLDETELVHPMQCGMLLCFQNLDECFLRNIDPADAFHPFFSFFLFLKQFPLSCDIAAVAFRGYVFAQG